MAEGEEGGRQGGNGGGRPDEVMDRSLDEVSNVIHDILSEPAYSDPEPAGAGADGGGAEGAADGGGGPRRRLGRLSGLLGRGKKQAPPGGPPAAAPPGGPPAAAPPGGAAPPEGEAAPGGPDPGPERAGDMPAGVVQSLLEPRGDAGAGYAFDEFIDERTLVSRDAFGRKEMKVKVLEVSDEKAPTSWKLGDRVKVDRILVTVKHLESQEVEEAEFDIGAIERELAEKRHYTSTNRWVPTHDIKNGYVSGSRHTSLISDAVALDYISF